MTRARHRRTGALWFALLGGPAAWTVHLLASYPLVPLACRLQTTLPLNLVTLCTALVSAAAAATGGVAWRRLRRVGAGDPTVDRGGDIGGRALFMASAGAILGVFFLWVILVEGMPPILVGDPCIDGV